MNNWEPPLELNGIDVDALRKHAPETYVFLQYVIAGQPQCVNDICKRTEMPHQTVSYHTQNLHDKSLIRCVERIGRSVQYAPQNLYTDQRQMFHIWQLIDLIALRLTKEIDIGCVADHEGVEYDIGEAVFYHLQKFIDLFHNQGGVPVSPDKLRAKKTKP